MENDVYKSERWIDTSSITFREVGKSHTILSRLNHTGWYLDPWYDRTSCGVVWQLTGKNKKNRYLASCCDGMDRNGYDNDYFLFDVRNVYDTEEEAALYADQIAESYAERSKESYVKEYAHDKILETQEEISNLKSVIKEICLDIRNIKKNIPKTVFHSVLSDIKHKVKSLKEMRKLIKDLEENPWSIWEN
jgi:hypothetical protein